jgi:hypothetical protein
MAVQSFSPPGHKDAKAGTFIGCYEIFRETLFECRSEQPQGVRAAYDYC